MSEIRRLKEETRNPFTRSLLSSVEADRADSGACDRAIGALGLGAAVVAAASTTAKVAKATALGSSGAKGASTVSIAPAAAKGGALLLAKWVGIGVIGGAMAIGSAQYARHVVASSSQRLQASATVRSDPRAASPSRIPSPPGRLDPLLIAPQQSRGRDVPPEISKSAIVGTETPTISRNTALFRSPAVPAHLPSVDSVSTQLESLSAIRAAGFAAPQRVLALLDDFERRFPSSPLREEVAVLRIDALVDAGRRAEGATLASAFLAAHPASAYAQRVRSKVKSP
jgi:hypothetical protein